jgi:hypothetical protein
MGHSKTKTKYLPRCISLKTASSPAALALSTLDGDDAEAPKQETWMNLMIPPCSLEICRSRER